MICFPNAKINLGLNITSRRSDGYHLLETLFYPVPLTDTLEVHIAQGADKDSITVYGNESLGSEQDNLVLRAVRALRTQTHVPWLDIHLSKRIPSGAGMGGGSADASFMLTLLNQELGLGLSTDQMHSLALGLGADCPFFIDNTPAIGRGIGEQLTSYNLDLSGYRLVLLKPQLHISTTQAFAGLGTVAPWKTPLEEVLRLDVAEWRNILTNDFERSLFPLYPELAELKALLYEHGAIYASMTGSGSVIYGLFSSDSPPSASSLNTVGNINVWEINL